MSPQGRSREYEKMPDMPKRTPLLNGIRPPGNSFVLPEHKMVYISVTKVACTSLRWMVADLAGEDFAKFYRAPAAHQTRLMTIHTNRAEWKYVPQVKYLRPEMLEEISRDNGWFIFAMVRDPWTRLWSGWQSKFLVRHAAFLAQYGSEPSFPRVPSKPEEVLEDWRAFIEAAPWRTNAQLATDVHFLPQVRSVQPKGINYTRIYDLREMSMLISDIQAHLESVGKAKPLYLPRANENPLPLIADVFSNGVKEAIVAEYEKDFEAFPDRWNFDDLRLPDETWTMDAIRGAAFHTVANERISDLARELKAARRSAAGKRDAVPKSAAAQSVPSPARTPSPRTSSPRASSARASSARTAAAPKPKSVSAKLRGLRRGLAAVARLPRRARQTAQRCLGAGAHHEVAGRARQERAGHGRQVVTAATRSDSLAACAERSAPTPSNRSSCSTSRRRRTPARA